MNYRVDLFAGQERVRAEDVIALWLREGALAPAEAERRVSEVLAVATNQDGALVGVTTTYLTRNEQLQAELWHTRVFVAGPDRQSGLAIELARTARDHLAERFGGGDRRGIGVLFEVESEILKRFFPQGLWPRMQFWFIGENARGDHVRVFYFPGALAPEPDGGAPQGSA